jgi:hypothetical protein
VINLLLSFPNLQRLCIDVDHRAAFESCKNILERSKLHYLQHLSLTLSIFYTSDDSEIVHQLGQLAPAIKNRSSLQSLELILFVGTDQILPSIEELHELLNTDPTGTIISLYLQRDKDLNARQN